MKTSIKRIIREELSRLIEGDVVYPKFGGEKPSAKEPSLFMDTLLDIEEMLIDVVGSDDLDDEQNDTLNALLDHVQDMMEESDVEDVEDTDSDEYEDVEEEPFGGDMSRSEKSELERFKSWMKSQD